MCGRAPATPPIISIRLMISLNLAIKAKKAGLQWEPKVNDFFAIPDRGLDERVFVINDMLSNITVIHGEPALSFQGAPEWALDYLITTEVVWLPRESQIREALAALLENGDSQNSQHSDRQPKITLSSQPGHTTCVVEVKGINHRFESPVAADAYAQAYLFAIAALHEEESLGSK